MVRSARQEAKNSRLPNEALLYFEKEKLTGRCLTKHFILQDPSERPTVGDLVRLTFNGDECEGKILLLHGKFFFSSKCF